MPRYSSIAIVGVGLIGGSIGLALRERKLAQEVVGIGRREESLRRARECRAVDRTTIDMADGVAEAELVVLCTPVRAIVEHALAVANACPADAVITDAGSTKADVVAAIGQAKPRVAFVGSHPLAGDHRAGVTHARADLLEGRTVVVTPTEASPDMAIERVSQFWEALGAHVHEMSPDEHDRLLAAASHAPHLAAAALATATPDEALPFTGSGWQDATRIAAGNPTLWRDIIASNRTPTIHALARIEAALAKIRSAIEIGDDDRLEKLLAQAKRIRDEVG